jgi:hypothetical protein
MMHDITQTPRGSNLEKSHLAVNCLIGIKKKGRHRCAPFTEIEKPLKPNILQQLWENPKQ